MATDDIRLEDRRTDIINKLDVRVSVLEVEHKDLIRSKASHDEVISKLLVQDNDLLISFNRISSEFSNKFDSLIKQFNIGFRVLVGCATAVCTMVGGFWVYSHDLDSRYLPKIQSMITEASQPSVNIDDIQQKIDELNQQLKKLNDKKVIKASR